MASIRLGNGSLAAILPDHANRPQKEQKSHKTKGPELPPAGDWRTTDADEILRRQLRAREEAEKVEHGRE